MKNEIGCGAVAKVVIPLIYLMGFLYNTALFNVGNSGVPLYVLAVVLMIGSLIFKNRSGVMGYSESLVATFSIIGLMVTVMAHVLSGSYGSSELTQLGSRVFYILSFLCMGVFVKLWDQNGSHFIRAARWLTICYVSYGFYEYYAKENGYPLFLEALANNASYRIAGGLNGGWLGDSAVRVRTFWAEPSSSVLPVLLSLYLASSGLLFRRKFSNFLAILFVLIYALMTGSRNVYLVAAFVLICVQSKKLVARLGHGSLRTFMMFGYLFVIAFSFSWQMLVGYYFDDLSAEGRASSIGVGIGVWLQNIIFGTGFNTFEVQSFKYGLSGSGYTGESVIQSSFLSNLQQSGIVGTISIFLLLLFSIKHTATEVREKGAFWLGLFMTCALSGGMEFSSLFWCCIAVFAFAKFLYRPTPYQY